MPTVVNNRAGKPFGWPFVGPYPGHQSAPLIMRSVDFTDRCVGIPIGNRVVLDLSFQQAPFAAIHSFCEETRSSSIIVFPVLSMQPMLDSQMETFLHVQAACLGFKVQDLVDFITEEWQTATHSGP